MIEPIRSLPEEPEPADPGPAEREEYRRLTARREHTLQSLVELGRELTVALDLYETVDLLLFNLMGQLGTARSAVWLVPEEEGGAPVLLRAHGFHRATVEAIGSAGAPWLTERFRHDATPVLAWALREALDPVEFELVRHAEIALFAPLHNRGEQLGWLALGARVDGSAYTESDLQVLATALGMVAASLQNARLYNRAREANRLLRVNNEHLSGLDRLKTEFLSNVNHELRTPLAVVIATLDLVVGHGTGDPRIQSLLEASLDESRKLNGMIENLLMFSDAQNARLDLDIAFGDVAAVLAECVAERLPGVTTGLRELTCRRAPNLPRARFDRQALLQIVNELIDNAAKFTPRGSLIELRVDRCVGDDGDWVRIEVSDNGPGIAPDRIGSLFNSFQQGDGSATRAVGGLGMGLAFANSLAGRMNARLAVESTLGHGCTFRLLLPAHPGAGT